MGKLQVIVHPVKKEFQRKSCGFDHDTPDDFVKSQVRIQVFNGMRQFKWFNVA